MTPEHRPPGRPRGPADSLEASRRRKEAALADLRVIEVQKRRGELLPAEDVAREWAGILRDVRAGVLAVCSRIRARLPHLTVDDLAVFDEELRTALEALADGGCSHE